MKRYTVADIKFWTQEKGSHFFDKETMKFFGEKMSNYTVSNKGGRVFLIRKGGNAGPAMWEFFPDTKELKKVDAENA